MQGYNFRLCVTANKSNAVPFPKPHNYNRSDWKLLLKQFNRTFSKLPASAKLLNVNCGAVPLNKYDMNNGAFISTDWTGGRYIRISRDPRCDFCCRLSARPLHVLCPCPVSIL